MPRLLLLTLASMLSLHPSIVGQPARHPGEVSAQAMQSLKVFLQTFDPDLKDQFIAGFADLNGDGTPEAIVYLTSNGWCGSGGCTTLVLIRDADSWKLVTNIAITRAPIRLLRTKQNGWRNIGVWVQGGGIQPGYEAELRFDGKTYPANPSIPPARPSKGKTKGEILIAQPKR